MPIDTNNTKYKGSDPFRRTLERFIAAKADKDSEFSSKVNNPDKNLDDCIVYILNTIHKRGFCAFNNDEVYSLATLYYEDENAKGGKPSYGRVEIFSDEFQLTPEEIAELKQKAKDEIFSNELARLKTAGTINKQKSPQPKSASAPAEQTLSLF